MTEPEDLAEFQLFILDTAGDEEMVAGCSGPRETALREVLSYWGRFDACPRRLYEIVRIPVDVPDAPSIMRLAGAQ